MSVLLLSFFLVFFFYIPANHKPRFIFERSGKPISPPLFVALPCRFSLMHFCRLVIGQGRKKVTLSCHTVVSGDGCSEPSPTCRCLYMRLDSCVSDTVSGGLDVCVN